MRILGVDIGEKRTGVAVSDPEGILASPLCVIDNAREMAVIKTISELAREHGVRLIIVGQPRSLDGTLGAEAKRADAFGEALAQGSGLPVTLWNEQFSTVIAERLMREAGLKKAKMKQRRDAVAAAVILQSYLDSQHTQGRGD